MGGLRPKPLLPWQGHTVIEEIVTTLEAAGVAPIVVVTGFGREALEETLAGHDVRCVVNPAYGNGQMLGSVQAGLQALPATSRGALLALADQPQMEIETVRLVLQVFRASDCQALVVPSYRMRRGHPVALPRRLWPEVLALPEGDSLRTVIRRHAGTIQYVTVDTPSVLADLDTPAQYKAARQASEHA
jgi:molybdenum cofactor cytidylyltransferase